MSSLDMSFKMDVDELSRKEVIEQLKIRGETEKDSVSSLRKKLKLLLKLESEGKLLPPIKYNLQSEEECAMKSTKTSTEETQRRSSIPVKDWGLKFSGEKGGPSLFSFLEDVNHYRLARNVSPLELHKSAIDLFTGTALMWYKTIHQDVRSWEELVTLLKEEFVDDFYEEELMREINLRTQGKEEKLSTFIMIMKTYFSRLPTPLSEERKVRIIMKNMNPYYYDRMRGQNFLCINEVLRAGRKIQGDREHMMRFIPPPLPGKDTLEPLLAYRPPERHYTAPNVRCSEVDYVPVLNSPLPSAKDMKCSQTREVNFSEVSTLSPTSSTSPNTGGPRRSNSEFSQGRLVCWHCKQTGHRFKSCPKLNLQFCTKCGSDLDCDQKCRRCSSDKSGLNSRRGRE